MKPRPRLSVIKMGAYDADSTTPRVSDWSDYSYSPNTALDHSKPARARSQDAARNNPWIRAALRHLVSHEIGCGIQPRPKITDAGLKNDLIALWNDWTEEADFDGVLNFYAQQALLSRARYESGEVFVRCIVTPPSDPCCVPLRLQILEADLLPLYLNNVTDAHTAKIRQGIERNASGQRVAYWFYREHPGERFGLATVNDLIRVPASDVLHFYRPSRPSQLRGEPETLSVLYRAHTLDQFESAELTRKKIKARFAGVVWKENVDDNPLGPYAENATLTYLQAQLDAAVAAHNDTLAASLRDQITTERERKSIVDIEDGFMLQLALHERVELAGGDTGTSSGMDFVSTQLRSIASGMGVPYELMTGDYANTNDRIMRVILNAFYRQLELNQDLLISQILQPVWEKWLYLAIASRKIRIPGYLKNPEKFEQCEWRAHAWSYVNPLQEAETAVLKINNGLTSRSAAVAESGWDAADVDQQQAEDHARERSLGLRYGSVPVPATADKPTP